MASIAIVGSRGYPSTYGGFETLVRRLAPYLAERGHRVTVYGREQPPGETLHEDGVLAVNTRGVDTQSFSTLSFGATATMHAWRRRPDVALVLNVANAAFLPVFTRAGVPTIVNVDGLEWERDKWNWLGKKVFRSSASLTSRAATSLVFDAVAIQQYWHHTFGVDGHFIPYGADVPTSAVGSSRINDLDLRTGEYALVVARLVPENTVDEMLEAAIRARNDFRTVFVGSATSSTPFTERLESAARRGDVTWLGHVSDQDLLTQLWAHCGVYFHGHTVGGTNPALLQALALGAPVVAVDTPFNREVAPRTTRFVTPDATTIQSALTHAFNDRAWQAEAAVAGVRRVQESYTWESVCADYEELLTHHAMHGLRPTSVSR